MSKESILIIRDKVKLEINRLSSFDKRIYSKMIGRCLFEYIKDGKFYAAVIVNTGFSAKRAKLEIQWKDKGYFKGSLFCENSRRRALSKLYVYLKNKKGGFSYGVHDG